MPASFGTTARNALRYMLGTDLLSDVDEGFQRLAEDVDTKMASYSQGTLAARPAAGQPNRLYRATDTGVLYHDNGSTWDVVAPDLVVSSTRAPVGGEWIEIASGGAPIVLPSPTTANKIIGAVNAGASGSIELTTTGEIWTAGKSLKLLPGEAVVLVSDGANWIIRNLRRIVTRGFYEAKVGRGLSSVYTPSADFATTVYLSVKAGPSADAICQIYVDGVPLTDSSGIYLDSEKLQLVTFNVKAGGTWQCVPVAGPMNLLTSTYQFLGRE